MAIQLRIGINANKIEGSYGGGNQFANLLEKYLTIKGHTVLRKLGPKLDLILIVSSQVNLKTTSFGIEDIIEYKILNPNVVIIHRVNTCDEPRGSNLGINDAIIKANKIADFTVYVSEFIKDLFANKDLNSAIPSCVILNAADEEIFNPIGAAEWEPGQKLRIVTHHWSSNFMKGFDIYERLDQLLNIDKYRQLFEFTYIGNLPLGVNFTNTNVISPTSGPQLAGLLKQNHIYLTAARNEPGPNHCAEALACGLPIIYLKSGALPEYCGSFGIGFSLIDFEERLMEIYNKYPELKKKVRDFSYTGSKMASKYEEIFLHLISERKINSKDKSGLLKIIKHRFILKPQKKFNKLIELIRKAKKHL